MEIMEKHMQQGDIIDTSKYIIYLKKEINRPMQKLHRFLENQRNTLMNQDAVLSLEQFSDNPLTQNIELQKRRIVIAQKSLDISIKQLGEFLKKIS